VRGAKVLINTGTTPSVPPIEGLSDVRYWTSEDLLTLPELPSSLIVLGGGVIGVAMASPMGVLGGPSGHLSGDVLVLAVQDMRPGVNDGDRDTDGGPGGSRSGSVRAPRRSPPRLTGTASSSPLPTGTR